MFKKVMIFILFYVTQNHTALRFICISPAESAHSIKRNYNPTRRTYRECFLTENGKNALELTCLQLVNRGINRENIAMTYTSPLTPTIQTAALLAKNGIVDPDKLNIDDRLIDIDQSYGENQNSVRYRVAQLIDEVKETHQEGNVIFISHTIPTQLMLRLICRNDKSVQNKELTLSAAGFGIVDIE